MEPFPVAEYIETANRDRWLAIQIETLSAVEQVEEIAAVEGVDLLFIGPGGSLGQFGGPRRHAQSEVCRSPGAGWPGSPKKLESPGERSVPPWNTPGNVAISGCQLFSLLGDTTAVFVLASPLWKKRLQNFLSKGCR